MCVCTRHCTGSEFHKSSPDDVMLLQNAEGAKLPMTHPSDFYGFKRSYHFLSLSLDKNLLSSA